MRIAYVTQSYPPMVSGAANVVKNLAERMAASGHTVLVIAASERGESYKSVTGNLSVLRLRSFINPLRVGQRFIFASPPNFMKALREFQPDLLHTHEPLQLGILSLIYKRQHNIPALLTIHALPHFATKYIPAAFANLKPALETVMWIYGRSILHQFDAITTPTLTTSETVYAMAIIQPVNISNGVDLDTFKPICLTRERESALRNKLGIPSNVPIILHVGRLDADKRVDNVIRAVAKILQKTDFHLLIVGNGRQKLALQNLCSTLGIEKKCHFPGFISQSDGLPEIYRLAKLFVTTSEIETQGIVLLEAAASGLPIAAVRATCIHEIVHHGENGYLTEPDDIPAMSQTILEILNQPEKAQKMGQASRLLARDHNIQTSFMEFEKLYLELVTQRQTQHTSLFARANQSWQRAKEWMSQFSSTWL